MKYKIELGGRGGEVVIGKVKREVYDYFEENEIDIGEYADDWDNDLEVPEEFRPFDLAAWYDCDDLAHEYGASSDECYITVIDENENIIHDSVLFSDFIELGAEHNAGNEVYPTEQLDDGDVYFIGQSFEKGLFNSFEIETDSFDPSKLVFFTTDCDGWEIVSGVEYHGVELEDLGECSTTGKGSEYQLILVEKD